MNNKLKKGDQFVYSKNGSDLSESIEYIENLIHLKENDGGWYFGIEESTFYGHDHHAISVKVIVSRLLGVMYGRIKEE